MIGCERSEATGFSTAANSKQFLKQQEASDPLRFGSPGRSHSQAGTRCCQGELPLPAEGTSGSQPRAGDHKLAKALAQEQAEAMQPSLFEELQEEAKVRVQDIEEQMAVLRQDVERTRSC